ncbi:ABC transporter permease subunit [Natronosalvus caseinilyticus]|uniref:ABC transporter permease subunit n=1 Tax=Natronosalvus caseinilyticus TaxID=2953747 RepID=UPI0028AC8CB7|nr:ABC transporter permease subunit [Natronosalvus caseinilyticus]
MSWMHVASKDFADAGRSMMLWALTVVLVLLVAGVSAIPYLLAEEMTPTFEAALYFLFTPIGLLIPIIGLVVGYQAIVSERESGSIRFLLGLPNTRRDVILGKVIGRVGVVAVPTLIGFLVGAVVIGALYDGFIVSDYLGLLVFSLVMGLVYVSVAVGISASVSSRAKALAGVLVFFVIFDFLWEFILMGTYWALEGSLPGFDGLPAWYLFVLRLSPGQALGAIALTLIEIAGAEDLDLTAAGRVAGEVPFYLENWFAWIIVVLWIVVPVSLGYLRFKNAILS